MKRSFELPNHLECLGIKQMKKYVPPRKTADDYIAEIKKLVDEYERKFGKPPAPVPDPFSEEYTKQLGVGFHDYDEEPCAFRSFMKNNPGHTGPLLLSCPCRRCSVWC